MIEYNINNFDTSNFDHVIIGSGPAAITLAIELEKKGIKSIILEAGGENYSENSQNFYKGNVIGDKYYPLDFTRLRFFGGSSNHWAGICRTLDEYDFKDWEIKKEDLDKYLLKACEILEIDSNFKDKDLNRDFKQVYFKFSPPVNFKEKYLEKIKKSKNILLFLNTPLLRIIGNIEGNAKEIQVNNLNEIKNIKIEKLIICCGGIENSRILLWSQYQSNSNFLKNLKIGHFWMEHPHYDVGYFIGNLNNIFNLKDLLKTNKFISPKKEFIEKHHIGNLGLRFYQMQLSEKVKRVIDDLYCVAPNFVKKIYKNIFDYNNPCSYLLKMAWEQKPDFNNRITLSKKNKDKNNIPLVELYWKKDKDVMRTPKIFMDNFGKYIAKNDLGRVGLLPYLNDENQSFPDTNEYGGHHHMGGTRIGSNSENNDIVDNNLRVHGTKNLFVCGSSIFRTGGHANPTLSIVQFSLKLADHLNKIKNIKVNNH